MSSSNAYGPSWLCSSTICAPNWTLVSCSSTCLRSQSNRILWMGTTNRCVSACPCWYVPPKETTVLFYLISYYFSLLWCTWDTNWSLFFLLNSKFRFHDGHAPSLPRNQRLQWVCQCPLSPWSCWLHNATEHLFSGYVVFFDFFEWVWVRHLNIFRFSLLDAKAAEAAQSAYYDPNKPQCAYVPPPSYYVSTCHDWIPNYESGVYSICNYCMCRYRNLLHPTTMQLARKISRGLSWEELHEWIGLRSSVHQRSWNFFILGP